MKTLNRSAVVCLLGLLLSQAGCIVGKEDAHGPNDAARQGPDRATQSDEESRDRTERRNRDDQCATREHDPDCQDRDR